MPPLATIGALVEVTPWDELQHWLDAETPWTFVDDRTPFRFRVAGELRDDGFFYGLHGPVESGPERYLGLICSIMLRYDESDWHTSTECGASFRVAPSIARRVANYDPSDHCDIPFYLYPDAIEVEGYPRTSRFGGIQVIDEPSQTNNG